MIRALRHTPAYLLLAAGALLSVVPFLLALAVVKVLLIESLKYVFVARR